MKVGSFLSSSFLLLVTGGCGGGGGRFGGSMLVAATTDVDHIEDTDAFVAAIANASTDPANPSSISVTPGTIINLDEAAEGVNRFGLDLTSKYFSAGCHRKQMCTVKRNPGTDSGGRLFFGMAPFNFTFRGFNFEGGAIRGGEGGGAFDLDTTGSTGSASFKRCDFVDNRAVSAEASGGAIDLYSTGNGHLSLSCDKCNFTSNEASGGFSSDGGGAIFAEGNNGNVDVTITETSFSKNKADSDNGHDIFGKTDNTNNLNLDCTDTTTSGKGNDVTWQGEGTCTGPPTPEPTNVPSSSPSEQLGKWETITHTTFDNQLEEFRRSPDSEPRTVEQTNDGQYVYKGSGALLLREDGSVEHTSSYDVSNYDRLRLRMWIYTRHFKQNGYFPCNSWAQLCSTKKYDKFRVKYSSNGGNSWDLIEEIKYEEQNYLNGEFYELDLDIDIGPSDTTAMIRLESDVDDDDDETKKLYIDEVLFEGYELEEGRTPWDEITYDDFEDGWGSFKNVANNEEDAVRVSPNAGSVEGIFVPQGNAALRIRDNSGRRSSVFHKDGHDLTAYSECQVSFSFSARDMEAGEGFWLQYKKENGSWTTAKEYKQKGTHDTNGVFYFRNLEKIDGNWNKRFYSDTAELDMGLLDTDDARIRFRCNGSGNGDRVYIDEVLFECRE